MQIACEGTLHVVGTSLPAECPDQITNHHRLQKVAESTAGFAAQYAVALQRQIGKDLAVDKKKQLQEDVIRLKRAAALARRKAAIANNNLNDVCMRRRQQRRKLQGLRASLRHYGKAITAAAVGDFCLYCALAEIQG